MKQKTEKTRFTLLDLADFDAYKAEHVTLTEEEKAEDEKKRIVLTRGLTMNIKSAGRKTFCRNIR